MDAHHVADVRQLEAVETQIGELVVALSVEVHVARPLDTVVQHAVQSDTVEQGNVVGLQVVLLVQQAIAEALAKKPSELAVVGLQESAVAD